MPNGWGVHIAELPGYGVARSIGTSSARGVTFGGNASIPNSSTPENYKTVWELPGNYPWDAAPGTVSLVSDDAADTSGGTGAQTVLVEGIGTDGGILTEVVTMDGVSLFSTTATFLRVHRMTVISAGSEMANVGTIMATMSGSAVSAILPYVARQRQSTWTVPAEWKVGAIIGQVILSVAEANATVVEFTMRVNSPAAPTVWIHALSSAIHSFGGTTIVGAETPVIFSPGTNVELAATASTRNGAQVVAGIELLQL